MDVSVLVGPSFVATGFETSVFSIFSTVEMILSLDEVSSLTSLDEEFSLTSLDEEFVEDVFAEEFVEDVFDEGFFLTMIPREFLPFFVFKCQDFFVLFVLSDDESCRKILRNKLLYYRLAVSY